MARRVKDKALDTRAAREKLRISGKPYYRLLEPGLHLGYRKLRGRAGTWVARHYVGNQAYETEGIGTADDRSDADGVMILNFWQATEKARERAVSRAHQVAGKTGPLTVADVIEDYIRFLGENKKTAQDSRYRANAHILPALGTIEVEALTPDALRKWLVALAKTPARVRTPKGEKPRHREPSNDDETIRRRRASANKTFSIVRAALNRAWRDGRISSDAAWRRVEPFAKVEVARMRYLSVDEAKRLLNAAEPAFRNLLRAALATGARYGELARLTVEDFRHDSETLTIRVSKTGKSRHVVLTEEGVAFFSELCRGRPGHETMLRRANDEPWTPSVQAKPMTQACQRAKISPPMSFHGTRHTYASLSVMAGMPMPVLAQNLGHVDTTMIQKHYGHLSRSYVADEVRRSAPRFGFKPDPKVAVLS
jgi:integrase